MPINWNLFINYAINKEFRKLNPGIEGSLYDIKIVSLFDLWCQNCLRTSLGAILINDE